MSGDWRKDGSGPVASGFLRKGKNRMAEICPACGHPLREFRGKLVCKACGYFSDCCEGAPEPMEAPCDRVTLPASEVGVSLAVSKESLDEFARSQEQSFVEMDDRQFVFD